MILPALLLALTADLEILAITPNKAEVITDETYAYTVQMRNNGPDAAQEASVVLGVNALALLRRIDAPEGWTCDGDGSLPRFGYVVTCTHPSFPPHATAEFTLTLTGPQPVATPYRIGGRARTSSVDSVSGNNVREIVLTFHPSTTQADLVMTANGPTFSVRNDGPHDVTEELTAIFTGANMEASGAGWTCSGSPDHAVCTRPSLQNGATAPLVVKGATEGRVRAERIWDANTRNNIAKTGPLKLKRRAVRP